MKSQQANKKMKKRQYQGHNRGECSWSWKKNLIQGNGMSRTNKTIITYTPNYKLKRRKMTILKIYRQNKEPITLKG